MNSRTYPCNKEKADIMKNTSLLKLFACAAAMASAFALNAANDTGDRTPQPMPSQMQLQPTILINDQTKSLHVINENNDPDVVTRTYIMKNADPEELRPYLRTAARMNRIKDDTTKVECIRFNDGTGGLVVSAEDFRFLPQQHGMSFDEIIEALDQPGITSASGTYTYVYFPKFNSATWLYQKLYDVGLNHPDDPDELEGGKDKTFVDKELNALLLYVPYYNVKNINDMIKLYDVPIGEVLVKYTVYELDCENDGAMGVDFQAWKNGPGRDFFAIASRYAYGWDVITNMPGIPDSMDSHTQFVKFSPKWNTKYLDFLTAKGKASIITSGQISLQNNQEGYVESLNGVTGFGDGKKIPNYGLMSYIRVTDARVFPAGANPPVNDNNGLASNRYRFVGYDEKGEQVTLTWNDGTIGAAVPPAGFYRGDIMISRFYDGGRYIYTVAVNESEAAAQGAHFVKVRDERDLAGNIGGLQNIGYKVNNLYNVTFDRAMGQLVAADATTAGAPATSTVFYYTWVPQSNYVEDQSYMIYRDTEVDTYVKTYGFTLKMTPVVCEDASKINVHMTNTSLIGFTGDGFPRTSFSEVSTDVLVSHRGNKFVIGGLEKKNIVKSVDKVPWLGDLPIIGWALGSEKEVTKTSSIVAVLECTPVLPQTRVAENQEIEKEIRALKAKLEKSGMKAGPIDMNDYGYDQYIFDKNKKGVDKPPYAY